MRRLFGMSVIAIAVIAMAAGVADAGARCRRATGCCVPTCCTAPAACECTTVMQTCRQIVYDQQQVTCYRTCYEPVTEQKTIQCVRYVPETQYRQCTYTVCRPVYETVQQEVCQTVCRPEKYLQTIQVCTGHWEERPVPAPPPCAPATCAPATCAPAACAPAACCPPQPTTCRVWVPEIQQRQVGCVRYVTEVVRKPVQVQVCRMVAEQRVTQVPYTVCRPQTYTQTVNCVRWVAKQVPYTVTRCVPREVLVQVPVQVCKPVCPQPPACAPAQPACCGT